MKCSYYGVTDFSPQEPTAVITRSPTSPARAVISLAILLLSFPFALLAQQDADISVYRERGFIPLLDSLQDGEYDAGKYLANHTITISAGKTMTLAAGTEIQCAKGARIIIKGQLLCRGTPGSPVVFRGSDFPSSPTSGPSNASARWDGLYVTDGGELNLHGCVVRDSYYGISADTGNKGVFLDSVIFSQNSFRDLSVGSRIIQIPRDGAAIRCRIAGTQIQEMAGRPERSQSHHPSWKRPAGAASISVTIAGAAAMIAGYLAAEYFSSQYRLETTSSRATFLGDKRDRAAFIGNTGIILCSVGVIGLGISILF
jgi:hypothetical protein